MDNDDFEDWWDEFSSRPDFGRNPSRRRVAREAWNMAYRQGRLDAETHFREQLERGDK